MCNCVYNFVIKRFTAVVFIWWWHLQFIIFKWFEDWVINGGSKYTESFSLFKSLEVTQVVFKIQMPIKQTCNHFLSALWLLTLPFHPLDCGWMNQLHLTNLYKLDSDRFLRFIGIANLTYCVDYRLLLIWINQLVQLNVQKTKNRFASI